MLPERDYTRGVPLREIIFPAAGRYAFESELRLGDEVLATRRVVTNVDQTSIHVVEFQASDCVPFPECIRGRGALHSQLGIPDHYLSPLGESFDVVSANQTVLLRQRISSNQRQVGLSYDADFARAGELYEEFPDYCDDTESVVRAARIVDEYVQIFMDGFGATESCTFSLWGFLGNPNTQYNLVSWSSRFSFEVSFGETGFYVAYQNAVENFLQLADDEMELMRRVPASDSFAPPRFESGMLVFQNPNDWQLPSQTMDSALHTYTSSFEPLWAHELGRQQQDVAFQASPDQQTFVVLADDTLSVLSPATGNVLWTRTIASFGGVDVEVTEQDIYLLGNPTAPITEFETLVSPGPALIALDREGEFRWVWSTESGAARKIDSNGRFVDVLIELSETHDFGLGSVDASENRDVLLRFRD